MRDIGKAFRRPHRFAHCRFARATGTVASQGFRAAHGFEMGRMAPDVPHRYATRSWPIALGSRLYGSLIRTFGIRPDFNGERRNKGVGAFPALFFGRGESVRRGIK